jgi:hypothetical protein
VNRIRVLEARRISRVERKKKKAFLDDKGYDGGIVLSGLLGLLG